MATVSSSQIRQTLGYWLYCHRKWALIPLILLGLTLNWHYLPVHSGNFMMMTGAMGVLFGSLLRIICFTFVGSPDPVRNGTTTVMVTEGPYAITRNPLYLAEGAMALGVAMMSRMPWLVLTTIVAGIIVNGLVIEWEEETLRRRHGRAYEEYLATVPRWFSFYRFFHRDSYVKTRGRVQLGYAIRAEGLTLLIGLLAILAFLAKANVELIYWGF